MPKKNETKVPAKKGGKKATAQEPPRELQPESAPAPAPLPESAPAPETAPPLESVPTPALESASAPNVEEAESVDKPAKTISKRPRKALKKSDAPKRTPTCYALFASRERGAIKEQSPDLKLGDISKICGERWKALSDEEKQVWMDKASAMRAEYLKENPPPVREKKRKPSSYLCFHMTHRLKVLEEFPGMSVVEVSKKCGEAWGMLTDAEKAEWKEKARGGC